MSNPDPTLRSGKTLRSPPPGGKAKVVPVKKTKAGGQKSGPSSGRGSPADLEALGAGAMSAPPVPTVEAMTEQMLDTLHGMSDTLNEPEYKQFMQQLYEMRARALDQQSKYKDSQLLLAEQKEITVAAENELKRYKNRVWEEDQKAHDELMELKADKERMEKLSQIYQGKIFQAIVEESKKPAAERSPVFADTVEFLNNVEYDEKEGLIMRDKDKIPMGLRAESQLNTTAAQNAQAMGDQFAKRLRGNETLEDASAIDLTRPAPARPGPFETGAVPKRPPGALEFPPPVHELPPPVRDDMVSKINDLQRQLEQVTLRQENQSRELSQARQTVPTTKFPGMTGWRDRQNRRRRSSSYSATEGEPDDYDDESDYGDGGPPGPPGPPGPGPPGPPDEPPNPPGGGGDGPPRPRRGNTRAYLGELYSPYGASVDFNLAEKYLAEGRGRRYSPRERTLCGEGTEEIPTQLEGDARTQMIVANFEKSKITAVLPPGMSGLKSRTYTGVYQELSPKGKKYRSTTFKSVEMHGTESSDSWGLKHFLSEVQSFIETCKLTEQASHKVVLVVAKGRFRSFLESQMDMHLDVDTLFVSLATQFNYEAEAHLIAERKLYQLVTTLQINKTLHTVLNDILHWCQVMARREPVIRRALVAASTARVKYIEYMNRFYPYAQVQRVRDSFDARMNRVRDLDARYIEQPYREISEFRAELDRHFSAIVPMQQRPLFDPKTYKPMVGRAMEVGKLEGQKDLKTGTPFEVRNGAALPATMNEVAGMLSLPQPVAEIAQEATGSDEPLPEAIYEVEATQEEQVERVDAQTPLDRSPPGYGIRCYLCGSTSKEEHDATLTWKKCPFWRHTRPGNTRMLCCNGYHPALPHLKICPRTKKDIKPATGVA